MSCCRFTFCARSPSSLTYNTKYSNTAQVLTSLSEAIIDVLHPDDLTRQEALALLEESLELFQRTLTSQEFQISEMEANQDSEMADTPDVDMAVDTDTVSSNPADTSSTYISILLLLYQIFPRPLFCQSLTQQQSSKSRDSRRMG
jgi:hypothetical protein